MLGYFTCINLSQTKLGNASSKKKCNSDINQLILVFKLDAAFLNKKLGVFVIEIDEFRLTEMDMFVIF